MLGKICRSTFFSQRKKWHWKGDRSPNCAWSEGGREPIKRASQRKKDHGFEGEQILSLYHSKIQILEKEGKKKKFKNKVKNL